MRKIHSIFKPIYFCLLAIFYISGCSGFGGNLLTPSPIDEANKNPNSENSIFNDLFNNFGEEEEDFIPDTVIYVIEGTGTKSEDKKYLNIQGTTYLAENNQPAPAKVRVRKKGAPNFIDVESNDTGKFTAQLEADPEKPIEIVEVVVINTDGDPLSNILEISIYDIIGEWEVRIKIDEDSIDPICLENFPDFEQALEPNIEWVSGTGPTHIKLFHNDNHVLGGISHPLKFGSDFSVSSKGSYDLNINDGFYYDSGCFEKNTYQFHGEFIDFDYAPEGRYINYEGTFATRFQGENCEKACELSGTWKAKSYLRWSELLEIEKDPQKHTPYGEREYLKKTLIGEFEMPFEAGSFISVKPIDEDTLLALTDQKLYRIDHFNSNNIQFQEIFSLPIEQRNSQNDINVLASKNNDCEEDKWYLNGLEVLNKNWAIATFYNYCDAWAGFYLLPTDQISNYSSAKKILLPHLFNEIYSPIVRNNRLYVIGSQFPFRRYWNGYIPESLEPALIEYNFDKSIFNPSKKEYSFPHLKNPKEMLLVNDQLWILDGAIQDLQNYNENGGFLETWTWNDDELIPKSTLSPYYEWFLGSSLNLRNPIWLRALHKDPDDSYLYFIGRGHVIAMDIGGDFVKNAPIALENFPEYLIPDLWIPSFLEVQYPFNYLVNEYADGVIHDGKLYIVNGFGFKNKDLMVIDLKGKDSLTPWGRHILMENMTWIKDISTPYLFTMNHQLYLIVNNYFPSYGRLFKISVEPLESQYNLMKKIF